MQLNQQKKDAEDQLEVIKGEHGINIAPTVQAGKGPDGVITVPTVLPGKDGLLHISQISEERVENVSDYLSEGQTVKVHVMDVDPKGRVKLTMKGVEQ